MSERDDMVAEIQGLRNRIKELERERDEALAKYETIFAACEEAGAKINVLMKQIVVAQAAQLKAEAACAEMIQDFSEIAKYTRSHHGTGCDCFACHLSEKYINKWRD